MPIYPYVCTACGHEFDTLQKISDEPLTECPKCGEATLRKRLAAPAFQLKGTGWYETDFKHGAKGKQSSDKSKNAGNNGGKGNDKASGSDGDSKSAAGSGSSGGDSKPAAAAGTKDD
jgi:putative FmdB family regulatory protein